MKGLEPLASMRSFIPSLAQASLETSKLQDLGNIWPSNMENSGESWPSLGILHSRIQHKGLIYTTQIKSAKDCNITFRSNSTGGAAVGQIQAIIEAEKAGSSALKLYVIVKEYCPLTSFDGHFGYFAWWPTLGYCMYYKNLGESQAVRIEDVLGHCAVAQVLDSGISQHAVLILPLHKVSRSWFHSYQIFTLYSSMF